MARLSCLINTATASEDRNSELSRIGKELDNLSAECMERDDPEIHAEISRILREWKDYLDVRTIRKGGKRIVWRHHSHAINASETLDGRSAILCTYP